MLLSVRPELTPDNVYSALIDSAIPLGETSYDNTYGHGLVDAHMLLLPGELKGVVTYASLDPILGYPLADISVSIDGLDVGKVSDSWGAFSFSGLPPGTYSLVFEGNGYVEKRREVEFYGPSHMVLAISTALLGDVNLDGHINAADIVPLNRHSLGVESINHHVALLAADINGDGNVNAADIVPLNRHALGIQLIH